MRDEMNAADALPDVRREHPAGGFHRPMLYYITPAREIKPETGFFLNKKQAKAGRGKALERVGKRSRHSPAGAGCFSEWIAMAAIRQTPRIIG